MLINVHMGPSKDEQQERFDTLISPSGSVATLLKIEEDLGLQDIIGIDESFPENHPLAKENLSKNKIDEIILSDTFRGEKTTILFTTLLYNAEQTLEYVQDLKLRYGERVTIALGGQLVQHVEQAYLNNADIDSVCVGDAEKILPELLQDLRAGNVQKRYEGWVKDSADKKFEGMSYKNFWQIRERMREQKRLEGFSQLVIQGPGGPGCAWAQRAGQCKFCGLTNITEMSGTTLREHLANEAVIAREFKPDRFFDVANQFLPTLEHEKQLEWLTEYKKIREELGMTHEKYAYLTIGTLSSANYGPIVAKALRDIGIIEVYLGIDHFDKEALREQNKPHKELGQLRRALDALRDNGISFRAGLVLGSAHETKQTLEKVREGIRMLCEEYKGSLKHLGVFPVELIPGAPVFDEMREMGMCPELFEKLNKYGYLTREEQRELTRTFVNQRGHENAVTYEQIEGLASDIRRMLGEKMYRVDKLDPLDDAAKELSRDVGHQKFF